MKDCGIFLGRRKVANMSFSFFGVFKASSVGIIRAKLQAVKTLKNDMLVIFRLLKRFQNPSLVPVSSSFLKWAI